MGRPDGKKIKGIGGFDRMLALIVGKTRNESTNLFNMDIITKPLDEFIAKKRKDGIEYTYRDIVIAALVRVFYLRPRLNRFVIKGNFYQRNFIDVAMTVHKDLKHGAQETAVKCRFTGKETIQEIKAELDKQITEAIFSRNTTDDFADGMAWMPTWLFRMGVGFLRFMDRRGWLSDKFLYKTSPFHASIFFADLKSIHLDKIYHHLYNFGNCGFFCAMGKEKKKAIVDEKTDTIKAEKVFELGISEDERFVDGLYYSGMIKLIRRIIENMEVLESPPNPEDVKRCTKTWTNRKEKKSRQTCKTCKEKSGTAKHINSSAKKTSLYLCVCCA